MEKWLKTGSVKTNQTDTASQVLSKPSTSRDSAVENSSCVSTSDSKPQKSSTSTGTSSKKRKYLNEYLKYGFSFTGEEERPNPLCVVCGEVLSNGSMKPSLLLRHLESKHAQHKNKEITYFERLSKNYGKDGVVSSYFASVNRDNENAVEASFKISYHIAKSGKNHTIGEDLIAPCIKDAVQCMFGQDFVRKVNSIPLSNNTVSRRIRDISEYIEEKVVQQLKDSDFFSIQVDESTDIAALAILLVTARYVNPNKEFEENLLLCHALTERTTGEDVFNVIYSYFCEKEIDWRKLCGICTDGGKSMSGIYVGLRGRVKEVAPHVAWSHCCIHRQSLAAKKLPSSLNDVLNEAVKVVNFVKANATNSRLFKVLCEGMGNIHSTLLLHTEVRWLSRGKVLTRLFELRHELQVFFEERPFYLASKFHDSDWLQKLAYLADIFSQINKLNLELQNSSITVFKVADKIESMLKKIDFWKTCIQNNQAEVFGTLHDFLSDNNLPISNEVKHQIVTHLTNLKDSFRKYFPKRGDGENWIADPFNEENVKTATLTVHEMEKLLELSSDSSLKFEFKKKPLGQFWVSIRDEYGPLTTKALLVLVPFTNTELVERSFSSYAFIKNKYRNKLNASPDLRVYLSTFDIDFKILCATKQAQGSH